MARLRIEDSEDEKPELTEVLRPKQTRRILKSPVKPTSASAKEESVREKKKQRPLRKQENNTRLLGPIEDLSKLRLKEGTNAKPPKRLNRRVNIDCADSQNHSLEDPMPVEQVHTVPVDELHCDSVIEISGNEDIDWKPSQKHQSPLQKLLNLSSPVKSSQLPQLPSKAQVDLSNPFLGPRITHQSPTTRPTSSSSRPTSSSSALDHAAILTYEPLKRVSPAKKPTDSRPVTPPAEPPSPYKKLNSPSKPFARIPKAPIGESIDAFWSADVVNDWNEQYSPRKIMTSPRKKRFATPPSDDEDERPSPSTSPRKGSPKKKELSAADRKVKESKKNFQANKEEIADAFLKHLDDTITEGKISVMTASTGGVKIVWNKKLNTTAGRANWRRECKTRKVLDGGEIEKTYTQYAHIELSTKVIDDEERLINVLAHEFCHLCTFMISNVKNNPHGKEFKEWARKCTRTFAGRGVEVTTKHSYQIDYKYIWECTKCGVEFKRHSNSIDPTKASCGACKGALVQVKPAPRTVKLSEWHVFIKDHSHKVRSENAGASHAAVMEILGKMYRERGVGAMEDKKSDVDAIVKELEIITLDD